jgi:hypothetical protein
MMFNLKSRIVSVKNLTALVATLVAPLVVILASVMASAPAQAYFSTIDTGELIEPGKFQATFEPQIILNKYDGMNFVGRLDTGIDESSSMRGLIGFGKVDFQIGGFYKLMPFPDVDKQPALGGEAGVIFARVGGNSEFSIRLHPLASKKFETEIGDVTAYGSIPFGLTSRPDETFVPIQVAGGAEIRPINMPNLSFFGEVGINVNKAFSYISAAVAFRFDEDSLRRR